MTGWLSAFSEDKCFTLEGLPLLVDTIKKNADKLSPMSQELMMAVRVVKMLSTEPAILQLENDIVVKFAPLEYYLSTPKCYRWVFNHLDLILPPFLLASSTKDGKIRTHLSFKNMSRQISYSTKLRFFDSKQTYE